MYSYIQEKDFSFRSVALQKFKRDERVHNFKAAKNHSHTHPRNLKKAVFLVSSNKIVSRRVRSIIKPQMVRENACDIGEKWREYSESIVMNELE